MKKIFAIVLVMIVAIGTYGQNHTLGFGVGVSNFLGDLGKNAPKGKAYYRDLQASLFRPAFNGFYRYGISKRFAAKANLTIGWVAGDDRFSGSKELFSDDWFRHYRNLHFKSHILELGITGEFNILKYDETSLRDRFTPYVFTGIGIFHFSPKAEYNGQWVKLRKLGTEGQGLPGYGDYYSPVTVSIPFGIGVKYNINRQLSITFEAGHRKTFTDYIDDVSTVYPDPEDIRSAYPPEKAEMIIALSNRSVEKDVEGQYSYITAPGEQRGDPNSKDAYLFSTISITYRLKGGMGNGFRKPRKFRY